MLEAGRIEARGNPLGARPARLGKLAAARALRRDSRVLWILLAVNWVAYQAGIFLGWWSSAMVLAALIGYALWLNRRHLRSGDFSWASIFVGLLALFHLGYYLPAKCGWIEQLPFMPEVNAPSSQVAMLLFGAALLAFEAGVLSGCRRAQARARLEYEARGDGRAAGRQLLRAGLPVLAASVGLLAIFVMQQGGLLNTLRLSYSDYNFFLIDRDSRFVETGIQFFPAGLLISYAGLLFRGGEQRSVRLLRALAYLFILWLLLIGSRGTALLLFLGLAYVGHLCRKPLQWQTALAAGLAIAAIIPAVASYRSVSAGQRVEALRDAKFIPLAAALEMGQTYRTLVGFVDYFWKERHPLLAGESYWLALPQTVPNLGWSKGPLPGGEYYRSTVWITELLDPYTASVGGGLGSTGIGEPYANFGYGGVLGLFWLLGLLIGGLEQYFLSTRAGAAIAAICCLFAPINWYIRDDIYGTIRPVAWSLAVLWLVFHGRTKRSRQMATSPRPATLSNAPSTRPWLQTE